MISPGYVRKMAGYNRWMNEALYAACGTLSDAERKAERGAFFGSMHGTLNHLLWGDQIWMHRLAGLPPPEVATIAESTGLYDEFDSLQRERAALDDRICGWAESINPDWLERNFDWYSGSVGREMTTPNWVLVTHMFNHQTHHRGQVHCMLTQCGVETPTTDLPFAP